MRWQKSEEEEEDEEECCDSPTEPSAGQRMLAPPITYKTSVSLDSSPPNSKNSTSTALEYGDLHRHLMSLRRGSRVSRASSGMIELVEDALGGAVVSVMPVPSNGAGGSGTAGMDARYRKWQTRAYNFLERPRGPKAIAYHVVVWVETIFRSTIYPVSIFTTYL